MILRRIPRHIPQYGQVGRAVPLPDSGKIPRGTAVGSSPVTRVSPPAFTVVLRRGNVRAVRSVQVRRGSIGNAVVIRQRHAGTPRVVIF